MFHTQKTLQHHHGLVMATVRGNRGREKTGTRTIHRVQDPADQTFAQCSGHGPSVHCDHSICGAGTLHMDTQHTHGHEGSLIQLTQLSCTTLSMKPSDRLRYEKNVVVRPMRDEGSPDEHHHPPLPLRTFSGSMEERSRNALF